MNRREFILASIASLQVGSCNGWWKDLDMSQMFAAVTATSKGKLASAFIDLSSLPSIDSALIPIKLPILSFRGNAGYVQQDIAFQNGSFDNGVRLLYNFRPFYTTANGDNGNNTTVEQIAGPVAVWNLTTNQGITIGYNNLIFSNDGTHIHVPSFVASQGCVPFFASQTDIVRVIAYQLFNPARGALYLQFADFDISLWSSHEDGIMINFT